MRVCLFATFALVLCAHGLAGQNPPATPTPTFRTAIDLVELDVSVSDASGAPVAGLAAADFEVLEDGEPQTVSTLSYVDIPVERIEPTLTAVSDVATNTVEESRVYVIAMDEGITSEQILRARLFLRRFVTEYIGPDDVAAVVWVGRGRARDTQDFTSNRQLLLNAIDRFQGGVPAEPAPAPLGPTSTLPSPAMTGSSLPVLLPPFRSPGSSGESRIRMMSLRALAEFMAGMRGRRKSLLYVSTGLDFDMFDVVDYQGGVMGLALADAHAAMTAATRGNVTVYAIDPRGLSADGALGDSASAISADESARARDSRRSLRTFAEVTGGFAFTDQNDITAAFGRIQRENSSYYLLGFSSTNSRRDGRFRRLEVRVRRPGLSVKSRTGYVAPTGRQAVLPARASPGTVAPAVAEALASPLRTSGLPMKVVAAPFKGNGRNADVVLVVEVDAARLDLFEKGGTWTGSVDVAWLAISADGRRAPNGRTRSRLALEPDTYDRATATGLRFVGLLSLPPDRYQLRVAAGGLTGEAGGVIADLEVPDYGRAPLAISGLTLTSRHASAMPTHVTSDRLQARVALLPSASREFARDDVMALYAEVYADRRNASSAIAMRVSLHAGDGRLARAVQAVPESSTGRRAADARAFVAELPLDGLEAGGYVMRVEAQTDAGAAVHREIPVRVR